MNDYLELLKTFDWSYRFSDDYKYVSKCHRIVIYMYSLQEKLDKDGAIWLSYSGKYGKRGIPQPIMVN